MKTISLEMDDFQPRNHRFDILDKLRERYPDFKITMYTIPWDIRYETEKGGLPIDREEFKSWVNVVRHAVEDGWMEIAIHGLTHAPREFENMTARLAGAKIMFAEEMFKKAKIPFVKIFKAPQWLLSDEAKNQIIGMGYKVVEDGYYNWNVRDEFPVELDNIIGHGHIQNGDGCNNGIEESLIRLVQVPKDYKWQFVSEAIKEQNAN